MKRVCVHPGAAHCLPHMTISALIWALNARRRDLEELRNLPGLIHRVEAHRSVRNHVGHRGARHVAGVVFGVVRAM